MSKQISHYDMMKAKDNNVHLVFWELYDPIAWDEALRQDEILRTTSRWKDVSFDDRFDEVVRRVSVVYPEAKLPTAHKYSWQEAAEEVLRLYDNHSGDHFAIHRSMERLRGELRKI